MKSSARESGIDYRIVKLPKMSLLLVEAVLPLLCDWVNESRPTEVAGAM